MDPAAANPVLSSYEASQSSKLGFTIPAAICIPLILGSVVIKFQERSRRGLRPDVENWLMASSALLAVGFAVAGIAMFYYSDEPSMAYGYTVTLITSQIFYVVSLALVKLSLLWLFQKTMLHCMKCWKFSIVMGTIMCLYTIVEIVVYAMQCKPVFDQTTIAIANHQCVDMKTFELTIGCIDFFFNTIVVLMPTRKLYERKELANHTTRVALGFALVAAIIACIMSLIHALAPKWTLGQWGFLHALSSLITLTFTIISSAIVSIPALIQNDVPLASPTATHPHLYKPNAVVTIFPFLKPFFKSKPSPFGPETTQQNGFSGASFPSMNRMERARGESGDWLNEQRDKIKPIEAAEMDAGSRSMSPTSYQRLDSLSGNSTRKTGFMSNMVGRNNPTSPPKALNLGSRDNGITVQTEFAMSFEERQKRENEAAQQRQLEQQQQAQFQQPPAQQYQQQPRSGVSAGAGAQLSGNYNDRSNGRKARQGWD